MGGLLVLFDLLAQGGVLMAEILQLRLQLLHASVLQLALCSGGLTDAEPNHKDIRGYEFHR